MSEIQRYVSCLLLFFTNTSSVIDITMEKYACLSNYIRSSLFVSLMGQGQ